ncbi:response regulator [Alicyclobacillus acidocaldarius]|nr:response regulator transcription factor [Alicyclobacillus acidocaldarius]
MTNELPIRVAIADDNAEYRLTLADLLAYEPDMEVVAVWANGHEVLRDVEHVRPDVLLLDITMPEVDGLCVLKAAPLLAWRPKIVVLTMHEQSPVVLEAVRAGVSGYIVKDAPMEDLLRAIREAHEGRAMVHPQVMRAVLGEIERYAKPNDGWKDLLTAREFDVLCQMAAGKSNEQIAESLHITLKTAKNHVSHILAKLHVSDRSQAVLHAYRERWILPDQL